MLGWTHKDDYGEIPVKIDALSHVVWPPGETYSIRSNVINLVGHRIVIVMTLTYRKQFIQ